MYFEHEQVDSERPSDQYLIFLFLRLCSKKNSKEPNAL